MRLSAAAAVVLVTVSAAYGMEPPRRHFGRGIHDAWATYRPRLEECSRIAQARGVFGFAFVEFTVKRRDDWKVHGKERFSQTIPADAQRCVRRAAAEIAKAAQFGYVSDEGESERFEVTLGTPRPLLPAPAVLLPVWREALRTGDRRALRKMVPPDGELRGSCLWLPGSHAMESAAGLWQRLLPGAVARMWTDPNFPQAGVFDSLLPRAGSRNAYWLDTHVLLSDFLGDWTGGWRAEGGPGFRFCLLPVDNAWKRAALEHTAQISDCWKGPLAERLTHPRTCRPDFPTSHMAGSVYGPPP
jgi:hypothetical protein